MNTFEADIARVKRGRGRPRKHANNAAKQAAYRRRKQWDEREELIKRVSEKTPLREWAAVQEVRPGAE